MEANLKASADAYDQIASQLMTVHGFAAPAILPWSPITPTPSNAREVSEAAGWVEETNAAIEHVAKGAHKAAAAIRVASNSYP